MPDVIKFTADVADGIVGFGATGASSVHLGSGSGESHAYVVHFDPGGEIGMHEAGFDQLFLVVSGHAWLTVDGVRPDRLGTMRRLRAPATATTWCQGSDAGSFRRPRTPGCSRGIRFR
jgi:hypothetical protein